MKTIQKASQASHSHHCNRNLQPLKVNSTPHTSTSHPGTTLLYLKDIIHTKLQRKKGEQGRKEGKEKLQLYKLLPSGNKRREKGKKISEN